MNAGPIVEAAVGVAAGDWRQAIQLACAPLVRAGAVEQHYAERCAAIVEEQGPYIVLAPGIALAHARPEDGVRRVCLAAATLTTPVAFGHDDNDPVGLVLAFGSPDDESHLGLLGVLAEQLSHGLGETLRAAPDRSSALRALQPAAEQAEALGG